MPFAVRVRYEKDGKTRIRTYRFNTSVELASFLRGFRAAGSNREISEITETFTDEECNA